MRVLILQQIWGIAQRDLFETSEYKQRYIFFYVLRLFLFKVFRMYFSLIAYIFAIKFRMYLKLIAI